MKVLSKNEVDIILREAIEEAFAKFGANKAPAATTTTVANDPYFDCKFDNAKGAMPNCIGAFYEEDANGDDLLTVRIGHIHNQHVNDVIKYLNQTYPNILEARNASLTARQQQQIGGNAGAPHPIDITIFLGEEENFEKILPNIANFIAHLSGTKHGFYTRQSIEAFPLSVKGRISGAPSKKDFELAQQRMVKNIDEFLNGLKDPESLKVMGLIGVGKVNDTSSLMASIKNAEATGWKLSNLNRLAVLAQIPTATFVTSAWAWEYLFNREVIDKTEFAIITRSQTKKKKDLNALNQAAGRTGYYDPNNPLLQPMDNYNQRRRAGQLSTQEIASVRNLSNMLNPDVTKFWREKVYDVANTKLMTDENGNPLPDKWNEEVGYSDNLLGVPNAVAQQRGMDVAKANGEEFKKVEAVPFDDNDLTDVLDIFVKIYNRETGENPVMKNGTIGDKIAGVAYQYAEKVICPGFNLQRLDAKKGVCTAFALYFAKNFGLYVQSYAREMTELLNVTRGENSYENMMKRIIQDANNIAGDISDYLEGKSHERVMARRDARAKARANAQPADNQAQGQQDAQQTVVAENGIMEDKIEEIPEEPLQSLQESFFRFLDRMERING